MKLDEFRETIPWSRAELARQAGLDNQTVMKAETGQVVQSKSVQAILKALSRATGRTVTLQEIEGIVIR
jgi:DNA-binding XRE family transcriptional regulator